MTTDDTATVKAAPSPAEEIRSWLPDHTHVERPGFLIGGWPTRWIWSTPAGVWTVSLCGPLSNWLTLAGPTGEWAFGYDMATSLRQLRGVLVALDAIEVPR